MPPPSRRARWAVRLVAAALLTVTPGLVLTAPGVPAAEPGGRDAAWLPAWAMTEAVADVTGNADLFDEVSPFWYDTAACDEVGTRAGAGDPSVLAALRSKGLAVLPTVTATGLTPAAAVRCLGDDASRAPTWPPWSSSWSQAPMTGWTSTTSTSR